MRTSAIQEGVEVSYREVQGLVDQLQGAVLLRHPVHEVLTHLDAARKSDGRGGQRIAPRKMRKILSDRGGVGRGGRTRTIARQDDANSGRKAGVIHTAAARESIAR